MDRAAWAKAMTSGSPLRPGGGGSHWALQSRRKIEKGYGSWLTWIEAHGELDPSLAPGARATLERVGRYLADLQAASAPFTVQSRLQDLGDALTVMTATTEFRWITRGAARLRACATSTKNKRQKIKSPDQLVDLGMELMASAGAMHERNALAAALQYRDGLAIALLAYRPLQIANFAGIVIDRHLTRRGDGWWMAFAAHETKQRRSLDFPFPAALEVPLRKYLALYRPVLAASGPYRGTAGDALWISADGGALTSGGLGQAIERLTLAAFGATINPHLFRDCAATMIAISEPEYIYIVATILGHSTPVTAERYYNQADGVHASRKWDAVLQDVRVEAKQSRARGRVIDDEQRGPTVRNRSSG